MPKQSKTEVNYTPEAKNHRERCDRCAHFFLLTLRHDADGHCTKVSGDINPNGWCKLFKAV